MAPRKHSKCKLKRTRDERSRDGTQMEDDAGRDTNSMLSPPRVRKKTVRWSGNGDGEGYPEEHEHSDKEEGLNPHNVRCAESPSFLMF